MASKKPMPGRCGKPCRNAKGYCEKYPVDGSTACRSHGGTGGRPIIHGAYSKRLEKVNDDLRDKIEHYLNDPEPDSLDQELAILKALRDRALEKDGEVIVRVTRDGEKVKVEYDSTSAVIRLNDGIRKTAASRTQMRNQTALTVAQLAVWIGNTYETIREFVPESQWSAVASRLRRAGNLELDIGESSGS